MSGRSLFSVLFGATILLGAARADATLGQTGWNSFFTIDYLDTSTFPGPTSDGYTVSGPGAFSGSVSNPANCTGSLDFAYPSPSIPAGAARELVARTLLSAFLAGKSVRLLMSGTNCLATNGTLNPFNANGTSGVPVYLAVAVQ